MIDNLPPIGGILAPLMILNNSRVFECILAGYENEEFLYITTPQMTPEQKELIRLHHGYLHEVGKNLRLAHTSAPPEVKNAISELIDLARSQVIASNDNLGGDYDPTA